ncbi:MAG: hypothetical protein H6972_14625 [Gammaproteobacteria bacterium]|nr:hypothetical protein [Gammaproteobacteria bacterium]
MSFLIIYVICYIIIFLLISRHFSSKPASSIPSQDLKINISTKKKNYGILLLIIGSILWLFVIDFDELINPTRRFSSNFPLLLSVSQWMILLSFILFLLRPSRDFFSKIFAFLSLFIFLLYPISISSRAVGIPFVILAIYYYLIKQRLIAIFFIWIGLVFFCSAIHTRGNLGFDQFFGNLILFLDPFLLWETWKETFPAIGTVALALEMFDDYYEPFGILRFVIYISPLPSFLIPRSIFAGLGFTEYLNATNIGLNTDILSEWIFWFGFSGSLIGGSFLAILSGAPIFLVAKGYVRSMIYRLLMQIAILFYVMAGMSMSIRASSRLFTYTLFFIFINRAIRNYYKKMRLRSE